MYNNKDIREVANWMIALEEQWEKRKSALSALSFHITAQMWVKNVEHGLILCDAVIAYTKSVVITCFLLCSIG